MREEMRELRGLVREVLLRPGQQQQPQQQPQQELNFAQLRKLQETLAPFGIVLSAQQPGLGAAGLGAMPAMPIAPALPPRDPEAVDFEKVLARKVRAGVEKQVGVVLEQVFNPKPLKAEPPPLPLEEEEEEDKPEADFDVIDVPGGVVWPGTTTPMRYARDRDTGDIHWVGTALGNPHAFDKYGEKVIDFVGKLADGIKSGALGLGKPPTQQIPQQVREAMNGPQPQPQLQPQPQPVPQQGDDDPFSL